MNMPQRICICDVPSSFLEHIEVPYTVIKCVKCQRDFHSSCIGLESNIPEQFICNTCAGTPRLGPLPNSPYRVYQDYQLSNPSAAQRHINDQNTHNYGNSITVNPSHDYPSLHFESTPPTKRSRSQTDSAPIHENPIVQLTPNNPDKSTTSSISVIDIDLVTDTESDDIIITSDIHRVPTARARRLERRQTSGLLAPVPKRIRPVNTTTPSQPDDLSLQTGHDQQQKQQQQQKLPTPPPPQQQRRRPQIVENTPQPQENFPSTPIPATPATRRSSLSQLRQRSDPISVSKRTPAAATRAATATATPAAAVTPNKPAPIVVYGCSYHNIATATEPLSLLSTASPLPMNLPVAVYCYNAPLQFPPNADRTRSAAMKQLHTLILTYLQKNTSKYEQVEHFYQGIATVLAGAIEVECHRQYNNDMITRVRQLIAFLRMEQQEYLYDDLILGKLTPKDFVASKDDDLNPTWLKEQRQRLKDELVHDRMRVQEKTEKLDPILTTADAALEVVPKAGVGSVSSPELERSASGDLQKKGFNPLLFTSSSSDDDSDSDSDDDEDDSSDDDEDDEDEDDSSGSDDDSSSSSDDSDSDDNQTKKKITKKLTPSKLTPSKNAPAPSGLDELKLLQQQHGLNLSTVNALSAAWGDEPSAMPMLSDDDEGTGMVSDNDHDHDNNDGDGDGIGSSESLNPESNELPASPPISPTADDEIATETRDSHTMHDNDDNNVDRHSNTHAVVDIPTGTNPQQTNKGTHQSTDIQESTLITCVTAEYLSGSLTYISGPIRVNVAMQMFSISREPLISPPNMLRVHGHKKECELYLYLYEMARQKKNVGYATAFCLLSGDDLRAYNNVFLHREFVPESHRTRYRGLYDPAPTTVAVCDYFKGDREPSQQMRIYILPVNNTLITSDFLATVCGVIKPTERIQEYIGLNDFTDNGLGRLSIRRDTFENDLVTPPQQPPRILSEDYHENHENHIQQLSHPDWILPSDNTHIIEINESNPSSPSYTTWCSPYDNDGSVPPLQFSNRYGFEKPIPSQQLLTYFSYWAIIEFNRVNDDPRSQQEIELAFKSYETRCKAKTARIKAYEDYWRQYAMKKTKYKDELLSITTPMDSVKSPDLGDLGDITSLLNTDLGNLVSEIGDISSLMDDPAPHQQQQQHPHPHQMQGRPGPGGAPPYQQHPPQGGPPGPYGGHPHQGPPPQQQQRQGPPPGQYGHAPMHIHPGRPVPQWNGAPQGQAGPQQPPYGAPGGYGAPQGGGVAGGPPRQSMPPQQQGPGGMPPQQQQHYPPNQARGPPPQQHQPPSFHHPGRAAPVRAGPPPQGQGQPPPHGYQGGPPPGAVQGGPPRQHPPGPIHHAGRPPPTSIHGPGGFQNAGPRPGGPGGHPQGPQGQGRPYQQQGPPPGYGGGPQQQQQQHGHGHPKQGGKPVVCKYYLRGNCTRNPCPFLHQNP